MAQRFAIIDGGTVANVAMATPDFAAEQGWIAAPDHVGPGWSWDGAAFSLPTPAPAAIPEVVTMRQARLALLGAGLLATVDAAIAQAGGAAQIEWEYAQEVRRDSPLIAQLAPMLGLTDAQIDALFVVAAGL